jgi:hypothetical protein
MGLRQGHSASLSSHDAARVSPTVPINDGSKVQSTWKTDYRHRNTDPSGWAELEEYLGSAFTIPHDCRLGLSIARQSNTSHGGYLWNLSEQWVQNLREFQKRMSGINVDVSVMDHNPWGGKVVYQLHLPNETDADRYQRWLEFRN